MKPLIKLKTTTLLVIPLVLACFALLPSAQGETQAETISPAVFAELPGFNTAAGFNVLDSLTTGIFNSGFGALALEDNTTGHDNTALGAQALRKNTTGFQNTAVGENALVFNIDGDQNMALGQGALANNLHGNANTAMGFQALNRNTVSGNTAIGFQAGFANSTGTDNVAVGFQALVSNTVGSFNVAVGTEALVSNIGAGSNTAVGFSALAASNGGSNTAVGESALANTGGSNNIALGAGAGLNLNTTGNNFNIDIGNPGVAADANTIRIGNTQTATFIAGISGATAASGAAVFVTLAGKLGTVTSSTRFKDAIKPMDKTSEAILALKPVTFRYKHELDPDGIPQFGLVAEEVEKVNPDLVARDTGGKVYTVRYEAINAMLLNEFLKEHRKVQRLEAALAAVNEQLKAQDAKIDKVNAKVELTKPAPQMVGNGQ